MMMMMTSIVVLAILVLAGSTTVSAFTSLHIPTTTIMSARLTATHPLFMFGGGGSGALSYDDDEEVDEETLAKMEAEAKALNMPLQEYKVGMKARTRLMAELDNARVEKGDASKIALTRDVNNPPKFLDITMTDAGKALGKDVISQELCTQLKVASEEARTKRSDAQKNMMTFVGEEMKRLGITGPPGMK